VKLLRSVNAPDITVQRIKEKSNGDPELLISYFDRAMFVNLDETGPEEVMELVSGTKKRLPLFVFRVSREVVFCRNTSTNEEVQFNPNNIADHVLFFLPLAQGLRGQSSTEKTWEFAELVAVLNNQLVKIVMSESGKRLIPFFILSLMKDGIAGHFLGASDLEAKFALLEHEPMEAKSEKYSALILETAVEKTHTEELWSKLSKSLDSLALGLIKSVFLFDYKAVDAQALGSVIYRIIVPGSSVLTHLVSEENASKILSPLLVEPTLRPLTDASLSRESRDSIIKRILNFTFLDPSNGTGSLLAFAMNQIATYISATSRDGLPPTGLKIENFRAICDDPIAAEISRIVMCFSYMRIMHRPGDLRLNEVAELFSRVNVSEGNSLLEEWKFPETQALPNFIVGVPKFKGWKKMTDEEKTTSVSACGGLKPHNLDYSAAWLLKAVNLVGGSDTTASFAVTNSLVQGSQVEALWPQVFGKNVELAFAYPSFKWMNDSQQNTGVSAVILGLRNKTGSNPPPTLRQSGEVKEVSAIGPYLVEDALHIVLKRRTRPPGSQLPLMVKGNMPYGKELLLSPTEKNDLLRVAPNASSLIRRLVGSDEFINGIERYCLWIANENLDHALEITPIRERIDAAKQNRSSSSDPAVKKLAEKPHQFREFRSTKLQSLIIPSVSSERRKFIPIGFVGPETIASNLNFVIYECDPWVLTVLTSSMHMIWARTTCGELETRLRYSNVLCYNTFPVPELDVAQLTQLDQLAFDLIHCREFFPESSLGDMYTVMPVELERQHAEIDVFVDGIYGLTGNVTTQDRLRKLMEISKK